MTKKSNLFSLDDINSVLDAQREKIHMSLDKLMIDGNLDNESIKNNVSNRIFINSLRFAFQSEYENRTRKN